MEFRLFSVGYANITSVLAMLLTGGSAVVTSLTGMPTAAACFLLPVGVVIYTMFGGIKATFLTDYVHTVILLVIIFIFAFTAYATNEVLGSPSKVYDLLTKAAELHPVANNAGGSYLTMRSKEGAIFFVINIVGNFGTVFCDNGYYNKAIAAHPLYAFPGYVMGGLSWFAIPWLCATTMGLAALALEGNHVFPSYPNRMPDADVSAGLVLPNAAVALLGKGGAVATLLMVFMAGISMGYLYLLMGVIVSSAVLPASLTLMWKRQNWLAATISPPLGLATALIAWLVTAKKQFGTLGVASTGSNYPMLAGNVAALLSPMVYIPILTFAFGSENYDYASMRAIRRGDDNDLAAENHVDLELVPGANGNTAAEDEHEQARLTRALRLAKIITASMTLILLILWPMPLYGTGYVFSKPFFTGWVAVGIAWLFFSAICVGLYPLWEGRYSMEHTFKNIYLDIRGKKKPVVHGRAAFVDESEGEDKGMGKGEASTPTEKYMPKD
ncbi:MAG: hypothetical protein M1835_004049 [Candelina submexicana]|nr:MAG: hypothetical protein M1835_004049 [Candelina submexicana]